MHVHLPAYVSDEGLPAWVGAAAMSLIGAGNVLGTLLSGHLAAKYAARAAGLRLGSPKALEPTS